MCYSTRSSLQSKTVLTGFHSLLIRSFFSTQCLNRYRPSTCSGVVTKGFAFHLVTTPEGEGVLAPFHPHPLGKTVASVRSSPPSSHPRQVQWVAFLSSFQAIWKSKGHHFRQRFLKECSCHSMFHLSLCVKCTFLRK